MPPIEIPIGGEITLHYALGLQRGESASRVAVWFFVPADLEFPGKNTWLQDDGTSKIAGMLTTTDLLDETTVKGISYNRSIRITAPLEEGTYECFYQVLCVGYSSEYVPFLVQVTPPDVDEEVPF